MNLEGKSETINALLYDLRAEYLVSCLLAEGISRDDIMVLFEGALKRKWTTDISHAEVESFENGKEALSIHLNRAGIYDSLPEALFHRFSDNRNATGGEMTKESMKLRLEEKKIRSFFRPFENELFMQNVYLALKETQEWQCLYSDFLNDLIPGFWKIDKKIPSAYVSRLIHFLPFAHQLAGRFDLTAQCLGQILWEDVSIELYYEGDEKNGYRKEGRPLAEGCLGKSKLGTDLIMGQAVSGFVGKLKVRIGPLKETKPKDFFPDGPAALLLRCFYGYFIPVELDVETKLLVKEEQRMFALSRENRPGEAYLSYNTVL